MKLKIRSSKIFRWFLAWGLLLATAPSPVVAVFSPSQAVSYLKTQPVDEWSVMALASAKALPGVNLDFLKTDPGSRPTDIEKRILAIAAAGADPQIFASVNLVQKLVQTFGGGEIAPEDNLLNDDIFGLLALAAVGTNQTVKTQLASFIKQNQNADGGWSYAKAPASSDSNDTAMAIMALLANGESSSSSAVSRGLGYLATTQTGGGYGFDAISGFGPDAASTAWVISAETAAGQNVPPAAVSFLQNLQRGDGSFSWQPGGSGSVLMTAYAVIALNNGFYPVRGSGSGSGGGGAPQFAVAILGPGITIFQGVLSFTQIFFTDSNGQTQTFGQPVAMGTVTEAASQTGFTYVIRNTSLGLFVDTIAAVAPVGDRGWMYAVNGVKPNIGASQYVLNNGDRVVWFYGSPNDPVPVVTPASVSLTANILSPPASPPVVNLTVSATQIRLGQAVTLSWSTQNAASVTESAPDNWANGQLWGQVTVQPLGTTVYILTAEGPGGVVQQSVQVNVDTTPSVVFGVDTPGLNFGDLRPGQTSPEQVITLINSGNVNLTVTAVLPNADGVYQQGLLLDSQLWNGYKIMLSANRRKPVSVQVQVPGNYEGRGQRIGTLVFWAAVQ